MVFNIIEDSIVILRMNGIFKQTIAYRRGDGLYAKHGNGFVRLYTKHATSVMKLSHEEIILPEEITKISDGFGRYNIVSTIWYNRNIKSKLKKETARLKRLSKKKINNNIK